MLNLLPQQNDSLIANPLPPSQTSTPLTLKEQITKHWHKQKRKYYWSLAGLGLIIIFLAGGWAGYVYSQQHRNNQAETNPKVAFLLEIYDKIKQNYWDKIPDDQLSSLYKLGAEKIVGQPQNLTTPDRTGVKAMLNRLIKNMNEQQQKDLAVNLGDLVLANLKPFNRSRLFTLTKEKELRDTVSNIDHTTDLYKTLGVDKNASEQQIAQTFQQKVDQLKKDNSPQAQQQLAEVNRAYQALGNAQTRQTYDSTGAEPTVIGRVIEPDMFYLQIKRISPTTLDEFQKVANNSDANKKLTTLILDLRGNIGGAIDILPYFLGFFLGNNNYAYEFYHQGQPVPFATKTTWLPGLVKFKKVVILTDDATQSTAEVITASLKKYNVGVVLGSPTKGWGTVENTFPLDTVIDSNESYSIFMVHSLTLRDDGQPIEGKGVDPTINIKDPTWSQQLMAYFNYQGLVDAIKTLIQPNPPNLEPKK